MGTSCQHGADIDLLRTAFPSWEFEARWISTASGPDKCLYLARKGDLRLTSLSADDLATKVTAETIAAALREDDES